MIRVLEHGDKIRMVPTKHNTYAVDTPSDLLRVEALMRDE
jgi:3-deoxy-manno-octulosonate cytidylyltransferase (CMP-KDO synthetase)